MMCSNNSSPDCDDGVVWTEKYGTKQSNESDWLSVVSDKCVTSREKHNKCETQTEKEKHNLRYERELNPYFRDDVLKKFVEKPAFNAKLSENVEQISDRVISNSDLLMQSNAINAKIIRAEMMGNQQLVNQLKLKLKQITNTSSSNTNNDNIAYTYARKSNEECDDESTSVKHMFLKAKQSTAEHETKLFVSSFAQSSKSKSKSGEDMCEDEYETLHSRKRVKHSKHPNHSNHSLHSDFDYANKLCSKCVTNIARHLILMSCEHIVVAFTHYEPFTYGYCYIQSISHDNVCTVSADEQCVQQITQTKRQICKLFSQQKLSVIFMETYFKRNNNNNHNNKHLTIECVPIKCRKESDLMMYFKKAIMECEHEWAINKKLVEMNGKTISKVIPKGLSYFWVTFGSENNGYAHVIEDDQSFSPHFGKEIIGGFLDIEPRKWLKQKPQNYDEQYKRVINLKMLAKSQI